MDRRTARLFAVLLIGIVVVTGVAAIVLAEPPGPDMPPGTEEMTGVVVSIDSAGLADVRGFVLRRPGGELVDFSLRELQNGAEFPPGHLAEHQATAEPIRVYFRLEDDARFALRLEDAQR